MPRNVLIIEDEADVIDVLGYFLGKEKFNVHVARDGLTGLQEAQKIVPDLILLDLTIPRLDGIEVCKAIKSDARLKHIPVLMVTAKGDETDKLKGFDTGADDYITKPFSPREVIARVKVHLRRQDRGDVPEQIHYENLSIDPVKYEVLYEGKEVRLTSKEFELLLYLIENKGRLLTRDMILNRVWGYRYFGTSRTVDVHITHLRQKISILTEAIRTIKPVGYKLEERMDG